MKFKIYTCTHVFGYTEQAKVTIDNAIIISLLSILELRMYTRVCLGRNTMPSTVIVHRVTQLGNCRFIHEHALSFVVDGHSLTFTFLPVCTKLYLF